MQKARLVNTSPLDPIPGIPLRDIEDVGGRRFAFGPVRPVVGRTYEWHGGESPQKYTYMGVVDGRNLMPFLQRWDPVEYENALQRRGGITPLSKVAKKVSPDEAIAAYVRNPTTEELDQKRPPLEHFDDHPFQWNLYEKDPSQKVPPIDYPTGKLVQTLEKHHLEGTNINHLHVFRQGDEGFLIVPYPSGFREGQLLGEGLRPAIERVQDERISPFKKDFKADDMIHASDALCIRTADHVLLVEPVDSYFPVALAASGVYVTAATKNYSSGEPTASDDTVDPLEIGLLSNSFLRDIAAVGGDFQVFGTRKMPRRVYTAAVVNGLTALDEKMAKAQLCGVLDNLADGGRLAVTRDGERTDRILAEAATLSNVTLEAVAENLPYDIPKGVKVYQIRKNK